MLKTIKISTMTLALATGLGACSPRLTGTWTVQRYETITPGQQGVTMTNIGTIKFERDGTGEKNLNYTAFGIQHADAFPFSWSQKDNKYITINSEGSDLAKTWIVMENKKKLQKWKSTDGANNVQIIELKK